MIGSNDDMKADGGAPGKPGAGQSPYRACPACGEIVEARVVEQLQPWLPDEFKWCTGHHTVMRMNIEGDMIGEKT